MKLAESGTSNTVNKTLPEIFKSKESILIGDYTKKLTVDKAQKSIQLSVIQSVEGNKFVESLIIRILNEALEFIPHELTTKAIINYTKIFIQEYWYWKIDDFVLCVKNGMLGKYGKIYKTFNFSVLMEWCNIYDKDKNKYYDEQLLTDHYKYGFRDCTTERRGSLLPNSKVAKKID